MNKDTFLIPEEAMESAQNICANIKDEKKLNRAVANAFAAKLAVEYFKDYEVDTDSGLHNIPTVLNDMDISDVYVQNSYIDVRIYFNENDLCVPKAHFDNNVLPIAYMFVKVTPDLSSGTVTGFITPGEVDRSHEISNYYPVNEEQLVSFYDVESLLNVSYTDELSPEIQKAIYEYLDAKTDGKAVYRELVESKVARLLLYKASFAKNAYNELAKDTEFVESINTSDAQQDDDSAEQDLSNDASDLIESTEVDLLEEQGEVNELEEITVGDDLLSLDGGDIQEFSTEIDTESFTVEPIEELGGDIPSLESIDELKEDEISLEPTNNLNEDETTLNDENTDLLETEDISLASELPDIEETNAESTEFKEYKEDSFENNTDDNTNIVEGNDDFSSLLDSDTKDESTSNEYEELPIQEDNEAEAEPEKDILDELSLEDFTEAEENTENIVEEQSEQVNEVVEEEAPVEEPELNNFSTSTTPSLETIEQVNTQEIIEDKENKTENIEELFPQENSEEEGNQEIDDSETTTPNKKKPSVIKLLGLAILIGAGVYYGYNKYNSSSIPEDVPAVSEVQQPAESSKKSQESAMPDESLENVISDKSKNEGNSISIPAIENHLDASVLVSNLAVTWEVPSGYLANSSAKRYFTKIGKILQLNLKTELLLINRPPLNNKIKLELKYNPDKQYFEIKDITTSSGEQIIDDIVKNTVNRTLEMNLNINLSTFGNIQGNPTLVINL